MTLRHSYGVNVIAPRTLAAFWADYPEAEEPLREWLRHVQKVTYGNFAEVRADYGSADWVSGFIVFNIGGNKHRLIVFPNFPGQRFLIEAVFTHQAYNAWRP